MASVQGWGRQTWNSGAWNTFAPVDATGNGLTSSLGSLTLTGDCNITLSGIGVTSALGTAVGTGVAAVVGTQRKRRIANIVSVGVGAGLVRGPGEWMVQVEVMPDFMGQCAAAIRIWKASGRGRSNGADLIVP